MRLFKSYALFCFGVEGMVREDHFVVANTE